MHALRLIVNFSVTVFALTSSLAASSLSFPGPPLPLEELWSQSTFVGLVNVTAVKQVENEKHVTLSLKKTLKTNRDNTEVLNVFVILGGCPYPFNFKAGQQVLVFLKFDSDREIYLPVGAAESAIELDDDTFLLYSNRLLELPAIFSNADKSKIDGQLLKWYIKCAQSPPMRYDGAWGISSLRQRKRAELTQLHCLEIVQILTAENPPGENSASLFEEISSFPNDKIDDYLLDSLRRSHEAGWSALTRSAIEHLPERLGIELGEPTAKRLDEYWELLTEVYYEMDDDLNDGQQPTEKRLEEHANAKERLAVCWGALSFEIYLRCKIAIDDRKK